MGIPTRRGHADIAAGNTIGTVLWFVLFNLALIALLTPVPVPDRVGTLDWPFLVLRRSGRGCPPRKRAPSAASRALAWSRLASSSHSPMSVDKPTASNSPNRPRRSREPRYLVSGGVTATGWSATIRW